VSATPATARRLSAKKSKVESVTKVYSMDTQEVESIKSMRLQVQESRMREESRMQDLALSFVAGCGSLFLVMTLARSFAGRREQSPQRLSEAPAME